MSRKSGGALQKTVRHRAFVVAAAVAYGSGSLAAPLAAQAAAGSVRGHVLLPPGEPAVSAVVIRYRPGSLAGPAADSPSGSVTCPIKAGSFTCPVPLGTLELDIEAGPRFTPHEIWSVTTYPSVAYDLGELRFERALSISGRISLESGAPAAGATVELLPWWPNAISNASLEPRLRQRLQRTTRVDSDGGFAFSGLESHWYVLRATATGLAPAYEGPFELKDQERSRLVGVPPSHNLQLRWPANVEVAVTPPLGPQGQHWHVGLGLLSGQGSALSGELAAGDGHGGRTDDAGHWSQSGLAPGAYEVIVSTESSTSARQIFELGAGGRRLAIQIPIVRVEGRLVQDDKPVAGTLTFSRDNLRVVLMSEHDGRFRGALPGEGSWQVGLSSASVDGGSGLELDPIEVHRQPGEGVAKLDLRIPATMLDVAVMNADGHPVPSAHFNVLLSGSRPCSYSAISDAQGHLQVRGLPAGTSWAYAWGPAGESWRSSGLVPLTLATGVPSELELTMRPVTRLRGRVVSDEGPVAGAWIQAFAGVRLAGLPGLVDNRMSGAGGDFDLAVMSQAAAVEVLVTAPGYALRWLRVPRGSPGPLEIALSRNGGTLIVDLPASKPDDAQGSSETAGELWVGHPDGYIPFSTLRNWASQQSGKRELPGGRRMVVPNVEGGSFSLCSGSAAQLALLEHDQPPADRCVAGTLAPGESLELAVQAPAPPRP